MNNSKQKPTRLLKKKVTKKDQDIFKLIVDFKSEILTAVHDEVKTTVNGKLVEIKNHLEKQDKMQEKQDEMLIKQEETLKKINDNLDPLVEIKKTTTNFGKAVMWFAGLVIAGLTIIKLIK